MPAKALFDVALMSSNVVQEIIDDVELARSPSHSPPTVRDFPRPRLGR
jgi:hypothetical protein